MNALFVDSFKSKLTSSFKKLNGIGFSFRFLTFNISIVLVLLKIFIVGVISRFLTDLIKCRCRCSSRCNGSSSMGNSCRKL